MTNLTVTVKIDNNLRGGVTFDLIYMDDTGTLRYATMGGGVLVGGKTPTKEEHVLTLESPMPARPYTLLVYYGTSRDHSALLLNRSYALTVDLVDIGLGKIDGAMLALSIVVAVLLVFVIVLAVWAGVSYHHNGPKATKKIPKNIGDVAVL